EGALGLDAVGAGRALDGGTLGVVAERIAQRGRGHVRRGGPRRHREARCLREAITGGGDEAAQLIRLEGHPASVSKSAGVRRAELTRTEERSRCMGASAPDRRMLAIDRPRRRQCSRTWSTWAPT